MKSHYCFARGGWLDGSCFLQFSRDGSVYEYWPCTADFWNTVFMPATRQGTLFNRDWRHHEPPFYQSVVSFPSELLYTFTHP